MVSFQQFRHLERRYHMDGPGISLRRLVPREDDLHSHDFLELVYVMQGSAMHQLGAKTCPVSEGDYFIVEFGSVHRYTETQSFTIVNCLFLPEFVDRAMTNSSTLSALLSHALRQFSVHSSPADQMFHDDTGQIRCLVETMEREFADRQAGWLELLRCHLIEILVYTERKAERTVSRQHPAVAALVEYVHDHSTEPLSLQALSRRLGYTPQYLSHLFHKEMGMTISAYVQQLRMEHCCRLLTDTALRISEIAQTVGYSDQKHFNHLFRQHTGFSPREFRAKVQRQKGSDHV